MLGGNIQVLGSGGGWYDIQGDISKSNKDERLYRAIFIVLNMSFGDVSYKKLCWEGLIRFWFGEGVGITSRGGLFLNPTRMDGYEGLFSLFKICHLYVSLLNNYAGRD